MKNVALITGASSGMGAEFARQLAARGMNLLAVSNQQEALENHCRSLEQEYNIRAVAFFADLSREGAAESVIECSIVHDMEVEILINNAGIILFRDVCDVEAGKAVAIMQLHMITPSLLCAHFGNEMKKRGRGYILNMSSLAAVMPYPGLNYYAATKSFLKSFTRSLRTELLDHGVSVTTVFPGAVATNLFDKNKLDIARGLKFGLVQTAEKVVRLSLRALFHKKASLVPGCVNKLLKILVLMAPPWLIRVLYRKYQALIHRTFVPMIIALLVTGIF